MSDKIRLRTMPYFQTGVQRVDRQNLMIYGATAMTANVEAIGHGMVSDMKTLELALAQANHHRGGLGIRGRFGHPGMSENAAGRKVMTSHNFRIIGDKLVHDIQLLEAARKSPAFTQDPLEYIMDMADTAPTEMAESAVIAVDLVWTLPGGKEYPIKATNQMEADGVELDDNGRPINALTDLPVMRPVQWYYLDLVNEGALTHDGMFTAIAPDMLFAGTTSVYLQEVFELIDSWRDEFDVPLEELARKFQQVRDAYIQTRSHHMANQDNQTPEKGQSYGREINFESSRPNIEESSPAPSALMLDTAQLLQDPEPEEPEDEEAPELDMLAEAMVRIAMLEENQAELRQIIQMQNQAIRALQTQVKELREEPVETHRVPRFSPTSYQRVTTPPPSMFNQTPGAMARRPSVHQFTVQPSAREQLGSDPQLAADFDADPVAATLQAQQLRQLTFRNGS